MPSHPIFIDVKEGDVLNASPQKDIINLAYGKPKRVQFYLWCLFACVVLMISVGGLTRLTDSGLSITEWKPITGAIPPLTLEEWESEFDKYKGIPEFKLQNNQMSLSEFKVIYWWEWGHRQLGRVIGLLWAVGFLWLAFSKSLPKGWGYRLGFIGALGGLQGAIGWWMVSSGLTGAMVDVASYRLATHLGLAFFILGVIYWYISLLNYSPSELISAKRAQNPALMRWGNWLIAALAIQILLGAIVAGLDAGRTYNDWPLMGGAVFPEDGMRIAPWWRNFFENEGLAQFIHRKWGYLLGILVIIAFLKARGAGNKTLKKTFLWVKLATWGQMFLGIATVLYIAPLHLAIAHQLLAVILLALMLKARFLSQYPPYEAIKP